MKKIAFFTLGCRANQYQTEVIKSQFAGSKLQLTDFHDKADVYIINTCTVTADADRKSRQAIRRALRQNPKAKVIVTGCYAKLESEQLKNEFPDIEIKGPDTLPLISNPLAPKIRTNLMIQDGCEHFCSYCIVPYARGKIKSKPLEEVLSEAKQLVRAGAREIVLTGINLGTYQFGLRKVLEQLSLMDDLIRIRLSSLEPMYISKETIDSVAALPKVCHHFHLPLQSGDNAILKTMNRNYSREEYIELIGYIRGKIPDCGITTDVMVGFPGEGEKEFQNTVDLIDQIKFGRLHIFSYSRRKSTPAADFPNQVDEKTKKHRSKILHEQKSKYMIEFARQYLNQTVQILVEQKGEGLTSNFIRCFFSDPSNHSGKLIKIKAGCVNDSGEIQE